MFANYNWLQLYVGFAGLFGLLGPVNKCKMSATNRCALDDLEGTTMISPGGDTRCAFDYLFGKHPYKFQVQPGKGQDRNKLLIFFEGGNVCLSNSECRGGNFKQDPEPRTSSGLFHDTNQENPFVDWTRVVVSYCTEDAHVGDKRISRGWWLTKVNLNGRRNSMAVFRWIAENIPNPDQVLLTGCSAGAMGVQFWSKVILDYYQTLNPAPQTTGVVVDGFVGVWPEDKEGKILKFLTSCQTGPDTIGLTPDQVQKCQANELTFADILKDAQQGHDMTPFGYSSYKNDRIVYAYTNLFDPTPTQAEHYGMMKDLLLQYTATGEETNNVVSYFLNGNGHCVLPGNGVFDKTNGGGLTYLDWVTSIGMNDEYPVESSCVDQSDAEDGPDEDFGCDPMLSDATFENGV